MTLPKKFEFCTKYFPAEKHIMENYEKGMYKVTECDGKPCHNSVGHTAGFVQACLTEGSWIMTKNLDVSPATTPVEREILSEDRPMVFPFTAVCSDTPFVVTAGTTQGYVTCTSTHDGEIYEDAYTVEQAKYYVKSGVWRVKHVGENIEEKPAQYSVKIDNDGLVRSFGILDGKLSLNNAAITASLTEVPQPPESTTISTLKVVVECDTTEALANAKALAGALEAVAIAYESVIALQKEFKGGV
jgi:hypothetical protein